MPDRPSRQDFVVSPQTSKLRFALTAAGCACAGFGVVWASLAVRGMLRGADAPARVERPDLAAEPEPVPSPIAAAAPLADEAPERGFARFPIGQTSFGTPPGDDDGDATATPQRYASSGRFGQALPPVEPELTDTSTPAMESGDERMGLRAPSLITTLSGIDGTEAPPADPDFAGPAAAPSIESPGGDISAPYAGELDRAADLESQAPTDNPSRSQSEEPVDDVGATASDEARLPEDLGDIAAPAGERWALAPSSLPAGRGNPLRKPAGASPPNTTDTAPPYPRMPAAAPLPAGRGNPLRQPAGASPPNTTDTPPQHSPMPAAALLPVGLGNPLRRPASPPPLSSTEAPSQQPFAAAAMPDAAPPPTSFPPPASPSPTGIAAGRTAGFADRADEGFDDGAPIPAHAQPARAAAAPIGAGMPFAAAPPIGPPPSTASGGGALQGGPAPRDASLPPDQPPPTPTGQGRPGAIQLEGVQTPQLAIEKRGPREIQVGKTARFEILVRNVGSATANDVVLRDSVPFGTALVATTPPASPTHAPGGQGDASATASDLVWQLGTLPPGGQARVALDVMPLQEGDVGSVASVSFRADASVRARATRPALEIVAEPPLPVLVGLEPRMTITISNPGSGIATGVVLEGLLPEGLTHRAGHELEFDVGSLPPGESRTIDLVLATTGPGVHALRLTARADGQIEVSETVKIAVTAPTLELAVQMPSRRYLQRPATCVLSMTNAGTAPAVGVEIVAQLPPGMKFIRATNAGYYEERTHRVLWNLEELPAAETGQVEVVVMPIALGPQKVVVAARTTAGLSDQIGHTVEVEGLAALAFEVADSEDPIEVGGVSEYVIRVANQGTKPASGVRVVATLLGDMEPVDARGPSPHRVDNLTISFEPLAKLAPSEEATYRIRVRGRREGDQRVQVQLTSDDQPAPITKEEITRVYADR
ncbi:MAG: DUF11 domain-containing protein [Planctomycetota bacterium]|nr:MAG: DUF11 domain-containing protein [Planctomycetota bacterium]